MQLTRTHRILIGLVVAGAVLIAAIGFAGSYAAVRELALQKGFGDFSLVFPIGIDAGICVLLALDLLLTWMRIPFPLLRQTAWLLTAATIAFNGAAAWPDPLGVGMHAVIPVLFVVSVEAARHAVGRIADITADKHMEGVRLTRWLLSPIPTFKLWRRMKLWELRSYEQVIKLEQDRLIYQARLQARFGRNWRRKAPIESLMPLRLAKYGVPLAETGPTGLAAAGIEPALLPPAPAAVAAVEAAPQPALVGAGQKVLTAGESHQAAAPPSGPWRPVEAEGAGFPLDGEQPVLPAIDYNEAVEGYRHQFGELPNARQFGLFLAQYGVLDPGTGGVLPEGQLRPVLQDFKLAQQAAHGPEGTVAPGEAVARQEAPDPADGTDARGGGTDAEMGHEVQGQPVTQPFSADPAVAPGPESMPVVEPAVLTGQAGIGEGEVSQPTALNVPAQRAPEAPAGEADAGESEATDTGAGAVQVPAQQSEEPALEPVDQQIVTVSRWLAEAEESGGRLTGAEVARRLGLSPKTGQRRVNAAAQYLEAERRQQARAHLRSVNG
ncbi:DUF2637 domain-containing protein [Streptomyces sp. CEV 2-1]|uniref:DUF2637 domain-containing protein n=1 Tax=Streptomyces sp. CEV 2-1 TaxID=2485153 RepID=UPI000F48A736|nr:DUF2637 domain-containing protein [Streptomyces sp. CEV 2-1]